MFIRVASDIHQEFFPKGYVFEMKPMPEDKDTVLVLAGDIDVGTGAIEMLEKASAQFKAVIYICGNHEYYNHTIGLVELAIKEEIKHLHNVHLLDGQSVIIDDFRFWGHTFWSNALFNMDEMSLFMLKRSMTDYRVIKRINTGHQSIVKFDPQCQSYYHRNALILLRKFLKEDFDGKTVVVTHHGPSYQSIGERFVGNVNNAAYVSDLDRAIKDSGIDLWCHGHLHNTSDYMINKTRIICNPYGYQGEELNDDYNPYKRIDLG